tara:strand:+ start:317 stop:673 length:357 start_codon:yes stop_codon:yes gene_type:complete
MESNEPQKVTGEMLKKMIEDVLQDYQLITPYPLAAEPTYTGEHPPENPDENEDEPLMSEEKVISYKGNPQRNWPRIARLALSKCSPQERQAIFQDYNVQTYDEFLNAVARYERAKKPK